MPPTSETEDEYSQFFCMNKNEQMTWISDYNAPKK